MIRPGIVLSGSGLHFAIRRLEDLESDNAKEAAFHRTFCECLFWLFTHNEDFEALIEEKTSESIHNWWLIQDGDVGKIMNALRFLRNRITHDYRYYWKIIDTETLLWLEIEGPTGEELSGPAGRYVYGQFSDYCTHLQGNEVLPHLKQVANAIQSFYMKFDLREW